MNKIENIEDRIHFAFIKGWCWVVILMFPIIYILFKFPIYSEMILTLHGLATIICTMVLVIFRRS